MVLVEIGSPCNSAWWQVDSIQHRLIYPTTHSTSPFGGWMDISDMFQTEFPIPPHLLASHHKPASKAPSPISLMATLFSSGSSQKQLQYLSFSFPTATLSENPLTPNPFKIYSVSTSPHLYYYHLNPSLRLLSFAFIPEKHSSTFAPLQSILNSSQDTFKTDCVTASHHPEMSPCFAQSENPSPYNG